ncbi:MAG: metallophosphatase family protein [candidate division WOR-3 bacterium]|nr:metallophosphatase family protein [candidate division WOR-3 bacterium]
MLLGIFSDVHSNLEALTATINFFLTKPIDKFLFVGDLVGYGASPNECIELVKKLNCIVVAGNHDFGVLGKTDIEYFNDYARWAIEWTAKQLNESAKDYLNSLPLENKYDDIFLVHSSPAEPASWRYIFTLQQAITQFEFFKEQICLVGHSHCPFIVEKNNINEVKLITDNKIKIKESHRYLINVGSVGQPRDGDNRACVGVLDVNEKVFEMYRIPYDINLAQQKIINAGLPKLLAYRLALGK